MNLDPVCRAVDLNNLCKAVDLDPLYRAVDLDPVCRPQGHKSRSCRHDAVSESCMHGSFLIFSAIFIIITTIYIFLNNFFSSK